ncbi:hypothetical protein [Flammeovirga sp. EKP202]|uniref:hypothetical protein n=1 Tax=Flammeovirga sp. EKP202 TaxID=2770592 RepID=UPI00165F5D30|nr:hypothetical protein [Flammeovirga sp. EKP202]MBD0404261.1 hypothetical protein [Flammeovirga sp. EKP202]
MKKHIFIFTFLLLILNACNDPDVDPSAFQEIFLRQENINIDLPDVTNETIDVQVLLNARPNAERLILILKGKGEVNGTIQDLMVEVNAQISNLFLNPDFSYSFIIEESTPIITLVNCDSNNPFSDIEELTSIIESVDTFKWDQENQQYYMDLSDLNEVLPALQLPSQTIYQSKGILERGCN